MKPSMTVTVSSLLVVLFAAASCCSVVVSAAEGRLTECVVDAKQLDACTTAARGDAPQNLDVCCNYLLDNTDTCLQCAVDKLFPQGSDLRTACFKQDANCESANPIRMVSA